MTREEILKLEPGPELDRLVAERVKGWKRRLCEDEIDDRLRAAMLHEGTDEAWIGPNDEVLVGGPPRFSIDIAAAWEVVEDRRRWGWTWKMTGITGHWHVALYDEDFNFLAEARAAEVTVAICRAALSAVMEVNDG